MKGVKIPYYVFVPIEEYNTGRSVWKDKPHTMIKKVAECQCIRMADQTCASTYSPDEMPEEKLRDAHSKAADLNKDYRLIEGETFNAETGEIKEAVEESVGDNLEPTEPVAAQNDCPYTFDEVKNGMEKASNLQSLNDLAAVISHLSISKEERDQLAKIYREKMKELKKAE